MEEDGLVVLRRGDQHVELFAILLHQGLLIFVENLRVGLELRPVVGGHIDRTRRGVDFVDRVHNCVIWFSS